MTKGALLKALIKIYGFYVSAARECDVIGNLKQKRGGWEKKVNGLKEENEELIVFS